MKHCLECGEPFEPIRISRVVCYNDKCWRERKRRQTTERYARLKEEFVPDPDRPYTSTTAMTIVSNLMRGESIKCIADLLDRDIKELKAYIKGIEQDGTAERIRRRLKYSENYNPYRNF